MRAHIYYGVNILPADGDHARQGYRWYIQRIHPPTGIPMVEDQCRHYYSLAQAREAVRYVWMNKGAHYMGLDMYLTKKTYVKNWDHMPKKHTVTVKGPVENAIKPERIKYIEEEVGYWRKANAIHKWFVDHCQDGVDDCRHQYVSRDQLEELRDLCRQLLVNKSTDEAVKKLPSQSGFFFGSTEYDSYYWDDVAQTEKMLTEILEEPNMGSHFEYHSSW